MVSLKMFNLKSQLPVALTFCLLLTSPLNLFSGGMDFAATRDSVAGIRKAFRFGEKIATELASDITTLFGRPFVFRSTDHAARYSLGSFSLTTQWPQIDTVVRDDSFGRLIDSQADSHAQENVETRRAIRLRLRIRF